MANLSHALLGYSIILCMIRRIAKKLFGTYDSSSGIFPLNFEMIRDHRVLYSIFRDDYNPPKLALKMKISKVHTCSVPSQVGKMENLKL